MRNVEREVEEKNGVDYKVTQYRFVDVDITISINKNGRINVEYYDVLKMKLINITDSNIYRILNRLEKSWIREININKKSDFILLVLTKKFDLDYLSDLGITYKRDKINKYLMESVLDESDIEVWEYVWKYINKGGNYER